MFVFLTRKDFNDIYDRLRIVEENVAVKSEHDKHISDKIDEIANTFNEHDKAEMIKYDSIKQSIDKLFKHFYMIVGAFLLFQYLITNGYINLS